MKILKELAKENLLFIALQGCRSVLERELEIPSVIFSMATNVRQELDRKAKAEGKELEFPYSYITLTSLAALKDRQSNYAVQKHGIRFNTPGERATTAKGYMFPITLGLDFHYIDNDPIRTVMMAQALVLLAVNKSLSFSIDVGDLCSFIVDLEIPLETTINAAESNEPTLPGATDLNVQFVMNTTIGFFRDVAAVNSGSPTMSIRLAESDESFSVEIPRP